MKLLLRLAVNAIALYTAIYLVPGIVPQSDNWVSLLWLALIFGVINAVLKPILTVAGCGFIILTLGLGTLVINTFLFWLAGVVGQQFGVGFTVINFGAAFLGALVTSVVSFILSQFLIDDRDKHRNHRD
jgi:putative membrane protein